GMGIVYSAFDPELDRRVALKLLKRADAGGSDRAQMMQEAQALARLGHPNVVTVYDVGSFENRLWIAMELLEGETLSRWRARGPRSWREVVEVMTAAGRGLAAAHAAGLVHRDFKPDNVMVGASGRVWVTDFGLARPPGTASAVEATGHTSERAADSPGSTPAEGPVA